MTDTIEKSVLIAGVGGQGILRASDILCLVAMAEGYDVKKSEVHGMAQRGGCVTSHVRYGRKVYSPIAAKGEVDILLSFEKLETLRYLEYLKKDGIIIVNDDELYPPAVNLGKAPYPDNIVSLAKKYFSCVKLVNGNDIASRAGNSRTVNIALLGVLSAFIEFQVPSWRGVIEAAFPQKLVAVNLNAFQLGRSCD